MFNDKLVIEQETKICNTTTEIQERTESEELDLLEFSKEDVERINQRLEEIEEQEFQDMNNSLELSELNFETINNDFNNELSKVEEKSDTTIVETQEAEDPIIEAEKNNNKPDELTDTSSMEWLDILAKLSVPYKDLNVLLDETPELKLVNDFFNDITCRK